MKASIIVPAFNEEKLIGGTLAAIRESMAGFANAGWTTELIVCDNNSTDRTAELARAAGAEVVFEPVNQIARARNTGAATATGDWLLFVDADSRPSAKLFAEVADAMATGRYLFGGVTIKLEGIHPIADFVTGAWNLVSRIGKYAAGSFLFCEAEVFRKVGGFDHLFFAGEELVLSRRLKRLARETGKKPVILHRHPMLTSARKLQLYSPFELLRFMALVAFYRGRTMRDRAACHAWYDGRR